MLSCQTLRVIRNEQKNKHIFDFGRKYAILIKEITIKYMKTLEKGVFYHRFEIDPKPLPKWQLAGIIVIAIGATAGFAVLFYYIVTTIFHK